MSEKLSCGSLHAGANHAMCDYVQAHSDALGSWGDNGAAARRAWEGDGRIDLRSVTNCLRQLPYHVAWQKGFRQAAGVLNPTVPIDSALETCRELGEGGSKQQLLLLVQLQVLAALSVNQNTAAADTLSAEASYN